MSLYVVDASVGIKWFLPALDRHRRPPGMKFRSSPETAAASRDLKIAAGVSAVVDPETNSGATK
jgi:hypothetical protein